MPCFCTVPADVARNTLNPGFTPILPSTPLSLKLALALPNLDPDNRLDMQIATGFQPETLPNLDFGGGPLANIAMFLTLMAGNFTLDDIPQLEAEMQQAADSLVNNVWPRLGWLTQLKLQPLLNYALVARLVLDLQDLGIDPFEVNSFPQSRTFNSYSFALTPLQFKMAKILGGLPNLMQMNEALNLPPIGDTGALPTFVNKLNTLAGLTPPNLVIPIPMLTKLALVLQSLATINEAFGMDFSPSRFSRIERMFTTWAQFPIAIPLGALPLQQKLDLLPTLEDFRLGESMAGSASNAFGAANFSPPKLAIAPFMNVVMALHASMQVAIDMEPFDMCSMCNC